MEKINFQLEDHLEVFLFSAVTVAEGRALGNGLSGEGLCGLIGTIQKVMDLRFTEGYGTRQLMKRGKTYGEPDNVMSRDRRMSVYLPIGHIYILDTGVGSDFWQDLDVL